MPSEGGPTPLGINLILFPFCFWTTSLKFECDHDTSVGRYTSPQPLSVFLPPLKPMPACGTDDSTPRCTTWALTSTSRSNVICYIATKKNYVVYIQGVFFTGPP